jgi:hypothetical protein
MVDHHYTTEEEAMRMLRIASVLVALAFLVSTLGLAQYKFKGPDFCKMCHNGGKGGTAYTVWAKTEHANAYKTLLSEAANKIAKEKGLQKSAAESAECLKCHVTGGGTAPEVKKETGVTCEACHGAASGFAMLHTKKETLDKAKAAGLASISKDDPKLCEKCHNPESPTFKKFDLKGSWEKIAHGLPAAK